MTQTEFDIQVSAIRNEISALHNKKMDRQATFRKQYHRLMDNTKADYSAAMEEEEKAYRDGKQKLELRIHELRIMRQDSIDAEHFVQNFVND